MRRARFAPRPAPAARQLATARRHEARDGDAGPGRRRSALAGRALVGRGARPWPMSSARRRRSRRRGGARSPRRRAVGAGDRRAARAAAPRRAMAGGVVDAGCRRRRCCDRAGGAATAVRRDHDGRCACAASEAHRLRAAARAEAGRRGRRRCRDDRIADARPTSRAVRNATRSRRAPPKRAVPSTATATPRPAALARLGRCRHSRLVGSASTRVGRWRGRRAGRRGRAGRNGRVGGRGGNTTVASA